MLSLTLAQGEYFWVPQPASTVAGDVDWAFYFILAISIIFVILNLGLMIFFAIKYRARPGRKAEKTATHSTPLELVWTIIPVILVIAIFYYGFVGFMNMIATPANAYVVNVTAYKWAWEFEHPNGYRENVLHVPANRPVKLVLNSLDVIHSFYVPAFRIKKDLVPGRYNNAWFEATEPNPDGYALLCAEYCGTRHSAMISKVVVLPQAEFEVWMEEASRSWLEELSDEQLARWREITEQAANEDVQPDPKKLLKDYPDLEEVVENIRPLSVKGREIYEAKGCNQCHTADGSAGTGPTFQGLWARTTGGVTRFADGTGVADLLEDGDYSAEDYMRDSILNPNEHIVAGYDGAMPTYQGRIKEREIMALIEYIKTLSGETQE